MINEFIIDAIKRHYKETKILFDQITTDSLFSEPVPTGRSLGEIIMHMIRGFEYYLQGLVKNVWEPLPYTLELYKNKESILKLYDNVVGICQNYLSDLISLNLNESVNYSNTQFTKLEILLEFLEHSVGHRGQILVYLRLLGIKPDKIPFKV